MKEQRRLADLHLQALRHYEAVMQSDDSPALARAAALCQVLSRWKDGGAEAALAWIEEQVEQ